MSTFQDISTYAMQLVSNHGKRDEMIEEMRRIFHMEWLSPPKGDWIKETMSPSGYNAAVGAVRLLTTTEPHFNVAYEQSDTDAKRKADKIEKAAKAMWSASSRVTGVPGEHDVALSSILTGEVCIAVSQVSELVRLAEKAGNKANIRRMRAMLSTTPYIFKVYQSATVYPDFDTYGTRGVLRKIKTTWGEVLDTWGELVIDGSGGNRLSSAIVCDWYDWGRHCVWVEGQGQEILLEDIDTNFLPVVCQITDGSLMFDRPDLQRYPFLYGMWKSGLWNRENLSLTTIFSLIFALGSRPLLKRKTADPGSPLNINRNIPGGTVDLTPDEDLEPLAEKVLDSSLLQGLQITQQIGAETTISKQALGQPPDQMMAYSAISLLAQSGRLPLAGTRNRGGAAIAQAVTIALEWMREDGTAKLYGRDGSVMELTEADIPERIPMQCILEPDLPQDKLQLAQVGQSLIASGLASKRWVQENILQMGQSSDMDKEIWMEKRLELEIMARLKQIQDQLFPQPQPTQQTPTPADQGEVTPGNPMTQPMPARGMPGG